MMLYTNNFKLILLFTIVLVFIFNASIYSEEKLMRDDLIINQLEKLNLSDLQEEVSRINQEMQGEFPLLNIKDLLFSIVRGEFQGELSWQEISKILLKNLGREITLNFNLLGQIIILLVISAILSIFHQSFSSKTISNTANTLIFLIIAVLILQAFQVAISIGIDAIDSMVSFMLALFPVLLALLLSMGALSSAAIFHPLTYVIITTLSTAIHYIVFPMIFMSTVISIVTRINENISLTRLAKLFKEISMSILALLLMLFIGGLLLQGGAAAVADSLTLRTAKYLTGTFVPVIGGIFSDAVDLIVSCSLIIKNALNFFSMFVIIVIMAMPVVKLIALIFIYKLASAIIQPIADSRLVDILDDTANSLIMVFLVVAAVSIMFFIVLTVIVGTANLTVMMR